MDVDVFENIVDVILRGELKKLSVGCTECMSFLLWKYQSIVLGIVVGLSLHFYKSIISCFIVFLICELLYAPILLIKNSQIVKTNVH